MGDIVDVGKGAGDEDVALVSTREAADNNGQTVRETIHTNGAQSIHVYMRFDCAETGKSNTIQHQS